MSGKLLVLVQKRTKISAVNVSVILNNFMVDS
jgi:hypothetical protein